MRIWGSKPPEVHCGLLVLRPLALRDESAWLALRERNRSWLRQWEATAPPGVITPTMTFAAFVRRDRREWRERRAINLAIQYDGALAGRVTLSAIEWASARSGSLGYWVDEALAGRGIAPHAVAALTKLGFAEGLHRVEIAARPENDASLRVVQKLGFHDEGRRERYLYIDGAWRDHRVFALRSDDPQNGTFWDCPGAQSA